ncbi:hypothetical protein Q3G72_029938 [Acer saccharum]|nr:hypothetical protein Q3G72_029938 [Acer saccharum]
MVNEEDYHVGVKHYAELMVKIWKGTSFGDRQEEILSKSNSKLLRIWNSKLVDFSLQGLGVNFFGDRELLLFAVIC